MRVLIGTFGSAGDLFPLVPIAERLEAEGDDVRFMCPRSLGLYLRAMGMSAVALGSGEEMVFFGDREIVTPMLGGWMSWHTMWERYLAPTLPDQVKRVASEIEQWTPDIVVSTSFAAAVRVAAYICGAPHMCLSIYPSHRLLARREFHRFGKQFRSTITSIVGAKHMGWDELDRLLWGIEDEAPLMFEPLLLPSDETRNNLVGYPYWDALPGAEEGCDEALEWMHATDAPVAIVTLGSFIGQHQPSVLAWAANTVRDAGFRVLVTCTSGARRERADQILNVGYVPMSGIVDVASVVVHHGGLGTTMSAIRGARPSVILPQAFDQPFVAKAVQDANLGIWVEPALLGEAVQSVARDAPVAVSLAEAAGSLVRTEPAASAVVRALRERASIG